MLTKFLKQMKKFLAGSLDGFVTVKSFKMLIFDVFLFSNKNNWDLLDSVCISYSIVFVKMRSIVKIIKDILDGSYFRR